MAEGTAPTPCLDLFLDPLKQSCRLCTEFDTVDMVLCDNETCKVWFHLACARVTCEEVANVYWECDECKAKQLNRNKNSNLSAPSVSLSSEPQSRRSSTRKKNLALKRIEKERRLSEIRDKEYLNKKYATPEDYWSTDSEEDRVQSSEFNWNNLKDNLQRCYEEFVYSNKASGSDATTQKIKILVNRMS